KDVRASFALTSVNTTNQIVLNCWGAEDMPDPALRVMPVALSLKESRPLANQQFVQIFVSGRVLQQSVTRPTRYLPVAGATVAIRTTAPPQPTSTPPASGT